MDFYEKYLKYKTKYFQLKNRLSGGAFEDVWNGLEEKITSEHMTELNDSVIKYVPTFTPHPLTSTIDGILAAFAIMSTDEFKKLKGVQNRSKQPNWYKENPEFSTIYNNQKYFNAFNELIKEINNNEINIHNGGDPLSGHNNNEIKKYKSTVILKGRK